MKSVHLTVRIKDELAERAEALQLEDENKTALYIRIIEAGLNTLEGQSPPDKEEGGTDTRASASESELDSLRLSVETLSRQLERQGEQLTAAMDHNAELTEALKREQETAQAALTLQGITQTKQLEEAGKKRRGFMSRLFGRRDTDETTD